MSQPDLNTLQATLQTLNENMELLVSRQRKQEEMFEEIMPIARLAMDASVAKLDELEADGTVDFVKELWGIVLKVRAGFTPQDVKELGDAVVSILDAVRVLTQEDVLRVAASASEALEDADQVKPLGMFGMMRATKSPDVQKGMAVMMEVLRRIGQGLQAMDSKNTEKYSKEESLARLLGPKRKVLGTERRLPAAVAPKPRQASAPAKRAMPSSPSTLNIDGIEFGANGHMLDASAWTQEVAAAIAASEGVEMSDAHWKLIQAARADFAETEKSPNIRRLTIVAEVSTKDIYSLFSRAPGRTIAKIAGLPKPAGCL